MADFISDKPETASGFFGKRGYYKYSLRDPSHRNIIDFNTAEKYFYGRVDRNYIPIVPRFSYDPETFYSPFRNFNSEWVDKGPKSAHSFVVDAFEDLAMEFKKRALTGQIDAADPFLSNLKIYKAYEDPMKLYNDYLNDYLSVLATEFSADKVKVENFDDFIQNLMVYLKNSLQTYAFTMSGFIKSRHCPITSTGLAIEISDLGASNDEKKVEQFWKNKNWDFFVNACSNYGFMIDQFVPWRLVADIGGPVMAEYAARYDMHTTTSILKLAFGPAYDVGYMNFSDILLRLYNKVKLDSFLREDECTNTLARYGALPLVGHEGQGAARYGKTTRTRVYPITYTREQLHKKYSAEYFIRLYCKIRFLEEESTFEEYKQNILIDDCIELSQSSDRLTAFMVFERIINKTFDYRGSLSYINKQVLAQVAEEQEEQGIPVSSTDDLSGY
tara:strand:+ start:296 stop:1627 length:1332 start_codon:yes stop_codon:yes gene_type:complete